MSARVAIVGGGYCGMAAAITLADAGVAAVVLEAGSVLGGRARRIDSPLGAVDNGQHLLLGAYRSLLRLIDRARPRSHPPAYVRLPLQVHRPGGFSLRAHRLPAPLHLALAVLTSSGLPLAHRTRALSFFARLQRRDFEVAPDCTVAQLLADQPSTVVDSLWAPLCTAALNTRPEYASAQVFANVLRAAFAGRRDDSDLILPTVDLSALFPEPAAGIVAQAGGHVELATSVQDIGLESTTGRWVLSTRRGSFTAEQVVIAVAPHQAAALLRGIARAVPEPAGTLATRLGDIQFEPIVTTYFHFDRAPVLPTPLVALDGAPGEWVIDRQALGLPSGTWAVVTSAAGALAGSPRDAIASAVLRQLRRFWPQLQPPRGHFVVTEKRATFRCTPRTPRPTPTHLGQGAYLAGDFTHARFPATLESAVATGIEIAQTLLGDIGPRVG